jgi:prepilin-type N-terminal cleavage/methylation domain-containing protein
MKKNNGFTLIELMIVIAIIGILMGATFKLMGVAAEAKARGVTTARLERLQYALSGYYAAYGMYPAVPLYGNPDVSSGTSVDEATGETISGIEGRAQAAARAQPIAFEYPTPVRLDEWIPIHYLPDNVVSLNTAINSLSPTDGDWDKYKGFKFGLMSFLLPRVELVGHPGQGSRAPLQEVYQKAQWMQNNLSSRVPGSSNADIAELLRTLEKQRVVENEAAIRWLPNFENMLGSFVGTALGVKIKSGSGMGLVVRSMQGQKVALAHTTITDGWGREFFYHSPPPYQSFRIWSAGPDGKTFPPWIPSTDASYKGSKAKDWIKDDIVGGKM